MMIPPMASKTTQKDLDRLDRAVEELKKRANAPSSRELADRTRKLAEHLASAATKQIVEVRKMQRDNQPIDGRDLSTVSLALEKVTKAVDALSKRDLNLVDAQAKVAQMEAERMKVLQRQGDDKEDLRNTVYRHEIGKKTKSPVIATLLQNTRKPVDEMTEEERAAQFAELEEEELRYDANEDPGADEVPTGVAEDSEVPEDLRPEQQEEDEGRS